MSQCPRTPYIESYIPLSRCKPAQPPQPRGAHPAWVLPHGPQGFGGRVQLCPWATYQLRVWCQTLQRMHLAVVPLVAHLLVRVCTLIARGQRAPSGVGAAAACKPTAPHSPCSSQTCQSQGQARHRHTFATRQPLVFSGRLR